MDTAFIPIFLEMPAETYLLCCRSAGFMKKQERYLWIFSKYGYSVQQGN